MPESEVWSVEAEGWRKAKFGVWKPKGGGKRSLECGRRVAESEVWSVRKGVGKRGLECGESVSESEAWSVEEACRKVRRLRL